MLKVFAVLRSVAREFLMWVGFFAVALVVMIWWKFSGDDGPKIPKVGRESAALVVNAGPVPAVAVGGVAPVDAAVAIENGGAIEGCACTSGVLCTGPRGGRYCLDDAGKKRYAAALDK